MNFTVTQLATADLVSIFLASDGIVESQWFLVSTSRWTTHNGRAATGWTPINVSDNYNTSYSNMLLEGLGAFLRANMDIWFILNHMLWNINRLTTKGQSLFLLTFRFFCYWLCLSRGIIRWDSCWRGDSTCPSWWCPEWQEPMRRSDLSEVRDGGCHLSEIQNHPGDRYLCTPVG